MDKKRLSTGIERLDHLLGGGLVPGTLTVVVGSAGAGKTQLGIQFAAAGRKQEGARGLLYDMATRGDSQSHDQYALRLDDWRLQHADAEAQVLRNRFFDRPLRDDYLHAFEQSGRRVTRADFDFDGYRDWQGEISRRLTASIAFLYRGFIRGVRRVVVDGVEPVGRASESIQLELFEYVYHQILRKEAEWVARDLLREHYRELADGVAAHGYDHREVGCMLLYTAHETTLDALIERPLEEGDLLSNANTVIYMGKVREGNRFVRAMYVSKHRGSRCPDEILPYTIDETGIEMR